MKWITVKYLVLLLSNINLFSAVVLHGMFSDQPTNPDSNNARKDEWIITIGKETDEDFIERTKDVSLQAAPSAGPYYGLLKYNGCTFESKKKYQNSWLGYSRCTFTIKVWSEKEEFNKKQIFQCEMDSHREGEPMSLAFCCSIGCAKIMVLHGYYATRDCSGTPFTEYHRTDVTKKATVKILDSSGALRYEGDVPTAEPRLNIGSANIALSNSGCKYAVLLSSANHPGMYLFSLYVKDTKSFSFYTRDFIHRTYGKHMAFDGEDSRLVIHMNDGSYELINGLS